MTTESKRCDYRSQGCTNSGKIVDGVWVCSNHTREAPDNMEQKAMEWYLRRMKMENEPPDVIEAAKTIDYVKSNVEMLAAFARSLTAPQTYQMSRDYEALWDIVCQMKYALGRVPCEVRGYVAIYIDIANGWISNCKTVEEFVVECQRLNLEWIAPTATPPLVPLGAIMEAVAQGVECAEEEGEDLMSWVQSCVSRIKGISRLTDSERLPAVKLKTAPLSMTEDDAITASHKLYGIPDNPSNDWCHNNAEALDKNSGFIDGYRYTIKSTMVDQMAQTQEALLRLMRSMDVEHRKHDFMDAAQNARDLLEKNGTPIRDNGPALIARAKAVELYPYYEAQRYGDGHPIGTFTIDVDLEVALFLEKHFSMVTENAPDGHDVDKIFNDPNGDGMSVSDGNESEDEFITLTCRDRLDARGQFTMMVGPDRLKDAVEALEKYRSENNIKTTT